MNAKALADFHITAKTPLFRLANCVRWFETNKMPAKAKAMRRVVTLVFVSRELSGGYQG